MARKKKIKIPNGAFTIGNYRGDLVHPGWSKFPGWGPDSPGPYTPDDLLTVSGRGDKDGNVWLTFHNYQGSFSPYGRAYPGRCCGADHYFTWGGGGEPPAGTIMFFDSPFHNTDPTDPDDMVLYQGEPWNVGCNYDIGAEYYLGKTQYHGGSIPCYYDYSEGYLVVHVQYYLSLSGYFKDAPVPPFRPAFPDPVLITFPAEAIPLWYYPGAINTGSQYETCDRINMGATIHNGSGYTDVLNQYGGSTLNTDQGLYYDSGVKKLHRDSAPVMKARK